MSSDPVDQVDQIQADLLKERSLWSVFRESLRIKRSKRNVIASVVGGTLAFVITIPESRAGILASQLHALSSIVLGATVSLLGFLIAGFSFFATVSDKAMFCRMAELTHKDSGLSYLKFNLFIFMRVFTEYLVMSLLMLVSVFIFAPDSAPRSTIRRWTLDLTWPCFLNINHPMDAALLAIGLSVVVGLFVYLLMELGSFIFNVYHVVMTTVAWELRREAEKRASPETALPTQEASASQADHTPKK